MTTPEICPLGVDGVLVRFARVLSEKANADALAFADRVRDAGVAGVTDVTAALVSVRVTFDHKTTTRDALNDQLSALATSQHHTTLSPRRRWHIPVAFGPQSGPQLAEIAQLAGLTQENAVAEITGCELRVIAIGFAPGQPYLGMLPPHWDIARQSELTAKMPQGALVVAVRQAIIFAADAPTGWRQAGQTAFRVFQPDAKEPFAFQPGDAVRFSSATEDEISALTGRSDTNGGARCEVLR